MRVNRYLKELVKCIQRKWLTLNSTILLLVYWCVLIFLTECSSCFYSIDKSSNFKPVDYQFMKKLRAENSQNREEMTYKLT